MLVTDFAHPLPPASHPVAHIRTRLTEGKTEMNEVGLAGKGKRERKRSNVETEHCSTALFLPPSLLGSALQFFVGMCCVLSIEH